jgi:hypothetical protein
MSVTLINPLILFCSGRQLVDVGENFFSVLPQAGYSSFYWYPSLCLTYIERVDGNYYGNDSGGVA